MCDDISFAQAPDISTGNCAPECFELACTNFTCGGLGTTCMTGNSGQCDEPLACAFGTDSVDCSSCPGYSNNSVCDEPTQCTYGSDVDCADNRTLYASVAGPSVSGFVMFTPLHNGSLKISTRLFYGLYDEDKALFVFDDSIPSTSGHKWHVHSSPVAHDNCGSAGGHYDPDGHEAQGLPWRGDLHARHGALVLDDSFVHRIDSVLNASELLGRSIVVHAAQGQNSRIACGTIRVSQCVFTDDGHCDEGVSGACVFGSDYNDCNFNSDGLRKAPEEVPSATTIYRGHLAVHYTAEMQWLSNVATSSSHDCAQVSRHEKCSGCTAASSARCWPGAVDFPSSADLCNAAIRSLSLRSSAWCDIRDSEIPPCQCLRLRDILLPDWFILSSVFLCTFILFSAICFVAWFFYLPAYAEFGYVGMDSVYGSFVLHPAQFYITRSSASRRDLALTVIENKLSFAPSMKRIRSWQFSPLMRRWLDGFTEELEVTEDLIILKSQAGAICGGFCCHACTMDAHEYYMPLRDANFIEIGAQLHPVFHGIALGFLTTAVAIFFCSFLPGLWESLERKWGWTTAEIDLLKYGTFVLSLILYLVSEYLAGLLKRGYLMFNVAPGGSLRGTSNPYAGNSPFFIRMKAGHPDMNEARYQEVMKQLRAAVRASRCKNPVKGAPSSDSDQPPDVLFLYTESMPN